MIYVWKLDKLIFPAWVSNICIKPWIGLQMFINCVCYNSVKPSKQASGRSILGRTWFGQEGVSIREEKAVPGNALWWQIDTLFDLWGRQPTVRGKERWPSYLCFVSFSTEHAHLCSDEHETATCHYWRILRHTFLSVTQLLGSERSRTKTRKRSKLAEEQRKEETVRKTKNDRRWRRKWSISKGRIRIWRKKRVRTKRKQNCFYFVSCCCCWLT